MEPCERCGCPDAEYVANPYQEGMGVSDPTMEWLCRDCYIDIAYDL